MRPVAAATALARLSYTPWCQNRVAIRLIKCVLERWILQIGHRFGNANV
jgi:hypothetical protein